MRVPREERLAIEQVLLLGEQYGYGNLIAHLQTVWAASLVSQGLDEATAKQHTTGYRGYDRLMQRDILLHGEYDETGERYTQKRRS